MTTATYDFRGQTALITGAAGDVGLATARRLARDGSELVLLDVREAELNAAVTELQEFGVRITPIVCDVTSQAAVTEAFQAVEELHGPVQMIFNNAGYQGEFVPTHEYSPVDFRRVLEVNVVGAFHVLQAAGKHMKKQRGGAIVNTASHAGVSGPPNMLAYGASKAAVIAMTETAAKDLAPYGVRVNAISPALIGPGMMWSRQCELQAAAGSQYFAGTRAEVEQQMLSTVPLRRLGSLSEVSNAVAYLLSDEASYVTGFNLEITGGI